MQIMLRQPEAKLLLCAPQNYSADLLASALRKAGVTSADMLRLNDPRLPPNQVCYRPSQLVLSVNFYTHSIEWRKRQHPLTYNSHFLVIPSMTQGQPSFSLQTSCGAHGGSC